jgi:flagellar protein FlbD
VISVTRANGTAIVVNADLIETIEQGAHTVITLVDGKQYTVRESTDEVVARIQSYRSAIVHGTDDFHPARLYVLPQD